jgi:hypothetical protein
MVDFLVLVDLPYRSVPVSTVAISTMAVYSGDINEIHKATEEKTRPLMRREE